MIWGVRIAIFTEIKHLVEELITFLSRLNCLQKETVITYSVCSMYVLCMYSILQIDHSIHIH